MTFKTDDRVFETSITTGTGTYTLDGAQVGFTTFAGMVSGNTCPYFATDDTNWEVGIGGILTAPNRLSRDIILRSSNADSAVNWGAGTRKIRCGLPAAMSIQARGLFKKNDPSTVGFVKTGAFTVSSQAAIIYVEVDGFIWPIPASTAVTMPGAPASGTDYAIWAKTDGTLEATSDHVTPPTANARKIGGFHYAPGGNATQLSKAAVPVGTAIGAQTVTINKWALYLLSVDSAGTITVTPAAGNVAGYANEAAAIAALPATPAVNAKMGYITLLTKAGTTWVAGTDALAGGASGNVATTTNYYSAYGVAMGLTLSRGTTDKNIASTAFTYYMGGDETPAINAYSIWDLKWRPACADPRGMTLVAGGFWSDIYLLGLEHPTNGSSKYNVTIADGSNPPRIPAAFGGNGSTQYGNGDWWNLNEVLRSFGKRSPIYDEFAALAYGTTEAASATAATDPVSTILRAESTSKWGVMLSTGNMYIWGANFGGPYGTATYTANTDGRGSTYELSSAVLLGGAWSSGALAGSRFSFWGVAPADSGSSFGARGVCDHLQLD